jgi:hypothetical protein
MSASHPGRPGPDELVPLRYALRVGEIDVMVVSDGVLLLPGAMLGHNVEGAGWPAVGRRSWTYMRQSQADGRCADSKTSLCRVRC